MPRLPELPEKTISAAIDEVVRTYVPEMRPHPTVGFPSDEDLAFARASNLLTSSKFGRATLVSRERRSISCGNVPNESSTPRFHPVEARINRRTVVRTTI